ncbi:choline kinase cytoplasm [Mycena maculata]|uniref:Choline kinase cytoplasm n=1 Tax=Mycena maculata TaxID=230809 RepID=A0AAD7JWC7_9AGAR|nr:choline kinase cytoplasm [Mycena maculata]
MNSPVISIPARHHSIQQNVTDILVAASANSSSSIFFADGDVEVVTEQGLRHAEVKLEARHYKQFSFASHLLQCLRSLKVPTWLGPEITPQDIRIHKVSGSLTNAVFFVSSSLQEPRTVLLRIYGPSSGSLISRPKELHALHVLSSQYRIGPRVYGTFENGRVEEYFECNRTLTASDLRDPKISRWIGARMAELHSVDIEAVEQTSPDNRGEGKGWEISAKKNVKSWIHPAREVLGLPTVSETLRRELDLDSFKSNWDMYMQWLATVDDVKRGSRRVYAHNDAQYGNLLLLSERNENMPEHRQIIVVDFEYAAPNPASYDIANHFHEWTANYHSDTPHILDHTRYPTKEERYNFYMAYLQYSMLSPDCLPLPKLELVGLLPDLDKQVNAWSPASHAMWAIWGIVQAREDLENGVEEPEFDYIGYAQCRLTAFRRELKELGL